MLPEFRQDVWGQSTGHREEGLRGDLQQFCDAHQNGIAGRWRLSCFEKYEVTQGDTGHSGKFPHRPAMGNPTLLDGPCESLPLFDGGSTHKY